ncbi:hypothetical protein WJX74_005398 [Apatococcus lobatus]|uniref:Uncharacterized protein n=1 Tax=Apatococcus lobatus TaxID=904363 RepID=A0AAW1RHQ5_9CHLO
MDVKVLRCVNVRDIVPKVPGISKDELKGLPVEENGLEVFSSLKLLGDVTTKMWRLSMSRRQKQYAGCWR